MKYKTYPKYKDSGVEWIGKVPEGWTSYKLKHVIDEFVSGGTPRSDDEKFWADEGKGIPWIAIGDMTGNEVISETSKSLTEEGLADKKLRVLKKGTLIYSIFASLGKVSILGINATTNQAILGLITSRRIDKDFLKYYLRDVEDVIITLSNANTQNNLNTTIVKNMDIPVPTIPEQLSIASFLDQKTTEIDALIDRDRRLIDFLREKRSSLINHAVTKGLDPKVSMKDSGVEWIGEIPEGWAVRRLKHLLLPGINGMKMGPFGSQLKLEMMAEKGYKVYGQENVINNDFTLGTRFIDEIKFKELSVYQIMPGDLLISTMGTIGNCRITPKDIETGIIDSHLIRMRIESYLVNNEYLAIILNDSAYSFYNIMKLSKGSIMTGLNSEIISNLTILVPSVSEQSKIVSYVNTSTSKIDFAVQKNQKRIDLMEEYKKSLIHHAVTGAIDVRHIN